MAIKNIKYFSATSDHRTLKILTLGPREALHELCLT